MKSTRHLSVLCLMAGTATLLFVSTGAMAAGRVYPSPEAVEPLKPGSEVPPVTVRTVGGDSVDLSKTVQHTGALLVFYRGGW